MVKTSIKPKEPLEVIVDGLLENPRCLHGPTLCFVRGKEKFFSCSAYRSREHCSFYLTEKQWIKINKQQKHIATHKVDRESLNENFVKVRNNKDALRCYCHNCSKLFLSSEEDHKGHDVITNLSLYNLENPSQFLRPLEDSKKEAQYLFTDNSIKCIINVIDNNKFRNVICIGAPRIHEHIKQNNFDLKSLLLDIDHRFYDFYKPEEFCHYNLFNNYFFKESDLNNTFRPFLKNSKNKICIVIDPPFGGRIELLKRTFDEISKEYRSATKCEDTLPIILVLPYFMEPHIKNHLSFKMSDYQVSYVNHDSFQNKADTKMGSPIRMFTNIPLENVQLPISEGYKFCKDCKKWVGKWNQHCKECDDCSSKNGTTYIHCDSCEKCVKSSWMHCYHCNRCCLQDHKCGNIPFTQKCFHCNIIGHKKSDCPNVMDTIKNSNKISKRNVIKKTKK